MALAAWEQVVAAAYPLTGLALLALGPLWIRRNLPDADGAAPPTSPASSADGARHGAGPGRAPEGAGKGGDTVHERAGVGTT
ncbi:hypothetical protein LUW77_15960 [Streptomyces radiopugnans]|nr:hypothetical protein LUW77_15960 [Streptomyces radiopugnans]